MIVASLLAASAAAAEVRTAVTARFTGSPSCSSTSCHGGGTGHNESIIYERRDPHAVAHGILGKGTSMRISEALGISDPMHAAQCTVCHAPMQGVPADRLVKEAKADRAVGCEACHGPAENWLRFHVRPDATFAQIVSAGMRDLNDVYGRANTCIACHLNLDESIRAAGHPELFFELDGQCMAQPPHYKDQRPAIGPRSWLTGQAAALRELSWKLAAKKDERLQQRWKATLWLLRKTDAGKRGLPETADFAAMQTAADKLAKQAANGSWTREQLAKQLADYIYVRAEFTDPKADRTELRRRAEVLVPALDRLWQALKKEGGAQSPDFEQGLDLANLLARDGEDFDPVRFAAALERLEVAFGKASKP